MGMGRIGKYEIMGFLGRGAWSLVFKVKIPVLEKIAALKLLHPHPVLVHLMGRDAAESLFLREARILGRLRHPNLLQVWDLDYWRERPFFVMEYYCTNLKVVTGRGEQSRKLRLDQAVRYALQVLNGLECLHNAGVVHRDIKPENILLSDNDEPKIADFGLVHIIDAPLKNLPDNLIIGSPHYSAPEQLEKSQDLTPRTDLYSVGVLLFKMLTGRFPDKKAPRLSALNPDCDTDWDDFIQRAMSERPGDRFTNVQEMAEALACLYKRWQEKTSSLCAMRELQAKRPSVAVERQITIRSEAVLVEKEGARRFFGLDELWRPGDFSENAFKDMGDGTVMDEACDLLWEKDGSLIPVTWHEAKKRAESLSGRSPAGVENWHLPTIDELLTIIDPVPHQTGHCIAPVFDLSKNWLWSSDEMSSKKAWAVNMQNGFVTYLDKNCYCYSRGVGKKMPAAPSCLHPVRRSSEG